MILRTATSEDKNKLLELEQAVVEAERPFNAQIKTTGALYYDMDDLLTSEHSELKVIELDNEIIATGYVQIRDSKRSLNHDAHGYLGFMYVDPAHRGKGLNKQLMDGLIEWAKAKGIKDFYLDVYAQNQAAINAYNKLGFTPALMEMQLNLD